MKDITKLRECPYDMVRHEMGLAYSKMMMAEEAKFFKELTKEECFTILDDDVKPDFIVNNEPTSL